MRISDWSSDVCSSDLNLDKDVFMSTGYYSRANPEMVLIGSTGEPTVNPGLVTPEGIDLSNEYTILLGKRGSPKRRSASVRQTVFAPLGKHSEKPLVFRSEIEIGRAPCRERVCE